MKKNPFFQNNPKILPKIPTSAHRIIRTGEADRVYPISTFAGIADSLNFGSPY